MYKNKIIHILWLVMPLVLCGTLSCGDGDVPVLPDSATSLAPSIIKITPDSGEPGAIVELKAANFDSATDSVVFDNVTASISEAPQSATDAMISLWGIKFKLFGKADDSAEGIKLSVTVPDIKEGKIAVRIRRGEMESAAVDFTILAQTQDTNKEPEPQTETSDTVENTPLENEEEPAVTPPPETIPPPETTPTEETPPPAEGADALGYIPCGSHVCTFGAVCQNASACVCEDTADELKEVNLSRVYKLCIKKCGPDTDHIWNVFYARIFGEPDESRPSLGMTDEINTCVGQ